MGLAVKSTAPMKRHVFCMYACSKAVTVFCRSQIQVMRQQRFLFAPFKQRDANTKDQCCEKQMNYNFHILNIPSKAAFLKSGAQTC